MAGGVLIGIAAAMFVLLNGRIAGISGILSGLLHPAKGDRAWRLAFVLGLLAAPAAYLLAGCSQLDQSLDVEADARVASPGNAHRHGDQLLGLLVEHALGHGRPTELGEAFHHAGCVGAQRAQTGRNGLGQLAVALGMQHGGVGAHYRPQPRPSCSRCSGVRMARMSLRVCSEASNIALCASLIAW